MSDARVIADQVNQLLAFETRSTMQHLHDAKPYLDLSSVKAWERTQSLQHVAAEHAEKLVGILQSLGQEPAAVSFSSGVAGLHYLRLDALLPLLIDEEKRQIAAYRRAIDAAAGTPVAKELSALLDENVHQLHELEDIHASLASPAVK